MEIGHQPILKQHFEFPRSIFVFTQYIRKQNRMENCIMWQYR